MCPSGSTLLQQTDGRGQTALDLVSETAQREELLGSAHIGDMAIRKRTESGVLNLPLLEFGSTLLAHLIFSYQKEKGLSSFMQPSNRSHSLVHRLFRTLERHSAQKVTLGWLDQRAVRLMEDAETLLELGRGNMWQVAPAVKECKEENTLFLMEMVENLKSSGAALVANVTIH